MHYLLITTVHLLLFSSNFWYKYSVGPPIVHRNRKRCLVSQSTLREELVEKKYQVFDIIGLLTILVQVNLSSPVERV